ncbi:DUF4189 domain-containing protein [Nocardia sp. AG03]|uniref:DUF4189 domain-containing protein n=1 Tax=Nocardia sp. AG03 TaxID=3025312 RepID=UPI0024182A3A|nr:DUF4189 domain-containing protein [Nocardia sp. AG03]
MKTSITTVLTLACLAGGAAATAPATADELRWTAVAVSPDNGLLNSVNNATDLEAAKNQATTDCDRRIPPASGSSAPAHDCRIVMTFASGQCGAVAVGDRISNGKKVGRVYSYSVGNSLTEADFDAVLKNPGRGVVVWWSRCQP